MLKVQFVRLCFSVQRQAARHDFFTTHMPVSFWFRYFLIKISARLGDQPCANLAQIPDNRATTTC
jgi:hypothetical protein